MDDVQYLRQNAKEESYLFMCDSKLRDRDVFPTPSEYEVRFSSPFRNVFSIDLIDATIPRTEYIIEAGKNTLVYAIGHPADVATPAPAPHTATVPPGDYNLPQLVEALNVALANTAALANAVPIVTQPATVPSEISNKLKFTCPVAFTLLMDTSGMRDALGFGNPVNAPDKTNGGGAAQYASASGWTTTSPANDWFLSVPVVAEAPGLALQGPIPVDEAEPVYANRAVRQYFASAVTGTLNTVLFAAEIVGAPSTSNLAVHVKRVAGGALVGSGVAAVTAGSSWQASLAAAGNVQTGEQCYVELSSTTGDAANHVAVYRAQSNIDLPGSSGEGDVRVVVDTVETPIAQTDQDLCMDVLANAQEHAVVSPGLVNLTGERYVNVRCPEIEQHIYRDRAFEKYHAGLGMIKLSGYGYRDQRYDFVSFPPRKFHVLGRLSKLTIRLEKADGTLYNAHGVDHTMLLVLRYYAQSEMPNAKSMLNPQYTPELHRYLADNRWAAEEDEEFNRPWR